MSALAHQSRKRSVKTSAATSDETGMSRLSIARGGLDWLRGGADTIDAVDDNADLVGVIDNESGDNDDEAPRPSGQIGRASCRERV